MKIIDSKAFLKLPENYVFSKYSPCVIGDFMVKKETTKQNNFYYQSIIDSIECTGPEDFWLRLEQAEQNNTTIKMNFDRTEIDGCFDNKQLYAVWDNEDIIQLIHLLLQCIK